ncbi:MAG: zinc ribbon domain-containing protein [Opitutaceae bacterium]
MATYVYETITDDATRPPRRFEVQQSMKDDPLTHDPESGLPVRRIITGGYGFVSAARDSGIGQPPPASGGCGAGCGCHHHHH